MTQIGPVKPFDVERIEPRPGRIVQTTRIAPELDLPAGHYRITGRLGPVNATGSAEVEIRTGETLELPLEIAAAIVQFAQPAGTGDTFWDLASEDGRRLWSTAINRPQVALAPGNYRITATRRGQRQGLEFTVAAGEDRTIEIPSE